LGECLGQALADASGCAEEHAQRAMSRKVKGSSNRKKAIQRLGDIHRRIAHQRSDWLHKLTTDLANRHAVIAIEDFRSRA